MKKVNNGDCDITRRALKLIRLVEITKVKRNAVTQINLLLILEEDQNCLKLVGFNLMFMRDSEDNTKKCKCHYFTKFNGKIF